MGIQTAAVLYPVNTTTVDTGVGIDIRLLDSAEAGANDDTQTVTATHTQDNQVRVFDPGSTNNTNRLGAEFQAEGWALRLADDMTPADDANCNAVLKAGTLTVNVQVAINQSGGTYASGTYAPFWGTSLWRVNLAADTATLISNASAGSASWTVGGIFADLGTFKNVAITHAIAADVEFQPGEVLYLQCAVGTVTIPNPTVGTATWTYTLRVDNANTNITFAAGQGIRTLCPIGGTSAGVAAASGVPVVVLPQAGSASGAATVSGALQAEANMDGTSAGVATASGDSQADANMGGISAGAAAASADLAAVIGTVGTVNIGDDGETIVRRVIVYDKV